MNTARWKRSFYLCTVMGSVIFQGLWLKAMEIPGEVLSPTSIITPDKNPDCKKTASTINALSPNDAAIQTEEDTQPDTIMQALYAPDLSEQDINCLLSMLARTEKQEQTVAPEKQKYAIEYLLHLTPLQKAVLEDDEAEARSLLQQGANPDEPDELAGHSSFPPRYFAFTPRQMAANEPDSPTSQLVLSWPSTEQ